MDEAVKTIIAGGGFMNDVICSGYPSRRAAWGV